MSEYSEEYTANDYHKLLTMAGEAIIALEAENRGLAAIVDWFENMDPRALSEARESLGIGGNA